MVTTGCPYMGVFSRPRCLLRADATWQAPARDLMAVACSSACRLLQGCGIKLGIAQAKVILSNVIFLDVWQLKSNRNRHVLPNLHVVYALALASQCPATC